MPRDPPRGADTSPRRRRGGYRQTPARGLRGAGKRVVTHPASGWLVSVQVPHLRPRRTRARALEAEWQPVCGERLPARRGAAPGRGAESRRARGPGSVASPFRPLLLGRCPDSGRRGPAARHMPRHTPSCVRPRHLQLDSRCAQHPGRCVFYKVHRGFLERTAFLKTSRGLSK